MNRDAPQTVEALEELLSLPSPKAVEALAAIQGDLLILGVGGKMGPTLARMAKRASEQAGVARRVIGMSRFSDAALRERLERWGVETIVGDLLDEASIEALPDVPNVVFMSGMKFGASRNPAMAWAMNCYAPALVCRRFRQSRIVAFSSGNVYPLVPLDSGGSKETDEVGPVGEYAMTVLGRERTLQYFSDRDQIPTALLRLNYATEMRYGVLVDIAQAVFQEQSVEVSTPLFNVIWQADANAMTLSALAHTAVPARIVNVAGPEFLRVRDVAEQFGRLMGKRVRFAGQEGSTAYLNDGTAGHRLLGEISVDTETLLRWTADWVRRGGECLGKPTHFQVRSGKF
ncbi:MAG: NAD(P)-dependent oxidoreductase [Candidatus Anammoximicrobium sp.]|nr:NAD(P)-dependent oxidoreductase [Candidatus Anammoximicrobium sp.]